MASRTTFALNFGEYSLSLLTYYASFITCPVFGGHFKHTNSIYENAENALELFETPPRTGQIKYPQFLDGKIMNIIICSVFGDISIRAMQKGTYFMWIRAWKITGVYF